MTGLPVALDLTVRLLVAALMGAGVGLEREIHGLGNGRRGCHVS